jgi:tetratricopeptide (TPR) repeat protein
MTLNNVAILYSVTQRQAEAEGAYKEALAIRRDLAAQNPEAYRPDVAMTLHNVAYLYSATQRLAEAEGTFKEESCGSPFGPGAQVDLPLAPQMFSTEIPAGYSLVRQEC